MSLCKLCHIVLHCCAVSVTFSYTAPDLHHIIVYCYTVLHCVTLSHCCTVLHCVALCYTVLNLLQCITLYYTVSHYYTMCSPHSNLDNPNGGCVFMPHWQAYSCKNLQHHMFVIESMDADTETRRVSPIALDGGNTGNGDYTDLLNGPMDHGEPANLDTHHTLSHTHSHTITPHTYTLTPPHPPTLSLHRLVHLLHLSQASLHILLPGCCGNRLLCVDDRLLSLSPSLPPAQRWTE